MDSNCFPSLVATFRATICISDISEYWSFCGQVHKQIDGLPDGSEIEIEIEIPERDGID